VTSRLNKFLLKLEERLNHIKSEPNWELIEIDAIHAFEKVYSKVMNMVVGVLEENLE